MYEGSVLVFADKVLPWAVSEVWEISTDSLKPVVVEIKRTEILLIGCGANSMPPLAFERSSPSC